MQRRQMDDILNDRFNMDQKYIYVIFENPIDELAKPRAIKAYDDRALALKHLKPNQTLSGPIPYTTNKIFDLPIHTFPQPQKEIIFPMEPIFDPIIPDLKFKPGHPTFYDD